MVVVFVAALVIGISLGLLGSGGSILTLPVLVFILNRPEKLAVAESLAIVGCIALVGSLPYAFRANIDWKSVLFFGLPGMVGAYFGACGSYYISGSIQLILFAIVMLGAAGMMYFAPSKLNKSYSEIRPLRAGSFKSECWAECEARPNLRSQALRSGYSLTITILQGFLVGCLTGFIGVGGGFLIVPALVLLSNLSMFFAIGTSLVIIAMNSFTGFIEQLVTLNDLNMNISWETIGIISIVGILGSFAGSSLARKIPQTHLRKVFSFSILAIGTYILFSKLV